jgi:hypothetical protein
MINKGISYSYLIFRVRILQINCHDYHSAKKDIQLNFNSLFVEVYKEESHHVTYKDVRFLYQYEQSL